VLIQVQNPKRDRLVIPPWTEKPSGPLHANSRSAQLAGAAARGEMKAGPQTHQLFRTILDPSRPPRLSSRHLSDRSRPDSLGGLAMQCPRCQHENSSKAKFCEECATSLARNCSNCGTQLSPTAKFCPECARAADAGAAQPRFASPRAYTP
jgi:Double zinc ribbon